MLLSDEENDGQLELYNPTVHESDGPRSQHQDHNRGWDSHQRQQEHASSAQDRARHAEQQSQETFDNVEKSLNQSVGGNVTMLGRGYVNTTSATSQQTTKGITQRVDGDVTIGEKASDGYVNRQGFIPRRR